MKLVFINKAGKLHNDKFLYELQFCENLDQAFMQGEQEYFWAEAPANGRPKPFKGADKICYFISEKELNLIKDSHTFSMEDAREGIVALAYSNERIFGTKLKMFFGMSYERTKEVLYEKNINMLEKENIFA